MTAVYRAFDRVQLDKQYDNRAAVPDHEEYFTRYRQMSEATRKRLAGRLDLAYGPSPLERLDVFPAQTAGAPTWIFFHGGYWRSLDKSDFSFIAERFVAAGITLVSANYALAPDVSVGEIVRQAHAATSWVVEHAAEWSGDPARVFLGGHSVGGHLAGLVAESQPVAGVTSISGIHDVEPVFHSYVNEWAGLRADELVALSPVHRLPKRALPLIVCAGADETDEFKRQAEIYAKAWRELNYPVTELYLAGENHFSIVLGLADAANRLTDAIFMQCLDS